MAYFHYIIETVNDDCYVFRSSKNNMKNVCRLYCSYDDDSIAIIL